MRMRPNVPMAIQVANDLRRRIRQETFPGDRLPSENTLSAEMGISRGTVRQALAILQQEGALYRHQGSGTFVNPHVAGIPARVDIAYEFGQLIQAAGYEPGITAVEVRHYAAGPEITRRLDVAPDAVCMDIRKLFVASGQPAIYVHEFIPIELILEPYQDSELAQPIFRFIEQRCHARVDYILSEMVPTLAEGEAADSLQLAPGTAILKFVEVFYSTKNKPLVLASVHFRDPLIRFHALRKMSQVG